MSNIEYDAELADERDYIQFLYRLLDTERATTVRRMADALLDGTATAPDARWHRQVTVDTLTARDRALRAADNGLCFGRVDDTTGGHQHIGRLGLFDPDADHRPLLLDWRAPAARPFYCATGARPDGLIRRRHFRTAGRAVTGYHDDHLAGEIDQALMAALDAPRGTTMRDIVATIQAEQDEIIRADRHGILVVEGGPGTGKTAVALHRVAYLLYAARERLSRWGVLVIGPNPGFLDYIGEVLPSLGETDVVFATPGDLMPGVRTSAVDTATARVIKGGLGMVDVLAAAVADRQCLPDVPITIELTDVVVALDADVVAAARERARATGLRHNAARAVFDAAVVDGLVARAVERIGEGWLGPRDLAIRAELAVDVHVELLVHRRLHVALDRLWPVLTPQRFLAELLGSRERLAAVGQEVLYRAEGAAWTVSDVPLLDEAAELLGVVDRAADTDDLAEYARGVLAMLDIDEDKEDERLSAVDLLDAAAIARRQAVRDRRDLAERAAADREWTYGHVVVDEAQELSAMDWRCVMRRCPSKSMTIVGDLAQRESPAGAWSWGAMLDRYAAGRWTFRELTVNYRTPVEIMAYAARVSDVEPPRSVRSTGVAPLVRRVADPAPVIAQLRAAWPGTCAVIGGAWLTPTMVKGLEFDNVIVVEPARLLLEHGAAGLYVALTRATQRLAVLHTERLPAVLC